MEFISVKATVTITIGGLLKLSYGSRYLPGKSLVLDLVSADLDPRTHGEKPTIQANARKVADTKYEAEFEVPKSFGAIGAVLVGNEKHKEMFLQDIVLEGFSDGPSTFTCYSWVQSNSDSPAKRIFFTNKSFLPSKTPNGLLSYRRKELELLRGNGTGERMTSDRIYDYDVYNDLGDPDSKIEHKRPVLGGKEHPYPRRCRTGRPPCKTDSLSESRACRIYVPRDERFADSKTTSFSTNAASAFLHALIHSVEAGLIDKNEGFANFGEIDSLYHEGIDYSQIKTNLLQAFPRLLSDLKDKVFRFETPALIKKDKFSWLRDEEFARQTLAGTNPLALKLVTEWPLRSALDPNIYGPAESAITKEIIESEIKGLMTFKEALEEKKLFILDYHDFFIPYVHKVRDVKGTTLYGSRTLFVLDPNGTLKPLAIELTRSETKPQWRGVFTPIDAWLWRMAKTHVLAHDSGHHELISHWLRSHCCTEPYIIAANRQLSAMHPIYRLLQPHFRYTMEINALAREGLINAGGIIESSFSSVQYSMELSSVAYDLEWQFDLQALPPDLIHRGLAVEDASAPHGLRLLIEDFPYANDGLLLWDAIKTWVTEYVSYYYPDPNLVESDVELQAWWTEIRVKGHGDKKDEPWWPQLKTPTDLVEIVTTIAWVASGHHAAVNFGQYDYGGYFPNRPTIARTNMPTESDSLDVMEKFIAKPHLSLLECFPSKIQAAKVTATLYILSNHSLDEEYLGETMEPYWAEEANLKAAFEKFSATLKAIEVKIDEKNANSNLKNRNGAGVIPYELLKPFSKKPGVTSTGVPYSISI